MGRDAPGPPVGPDDDWTAVGADADADGTSPPQRVGGRFRLLKQVARGGSGLVFRAWDEVLAGPAAVKLIPPDPQGDGPADSDLDRPPAELLFRDPVLVQVRDRGRWPGGVWVAMEWVEGHDLRRILGLRSPLLESEDHTAPADREPATPGEPGLSIELPDQFSELALIRALHDISVGIGAAHRQGLVHLDLKPDNIMLQAPDEKAVRRHDGGGVWAAEPGDGPRWKPRLIDWGLSQRFDLDEDASITELMRQARFGEVPLGVPAYMSPERAAGEPLGIQPTADVYALGAILYHILTGERPYGSTARAEALDLLRRGVPVPDPRHRADPDLHEFCDVCRQAMHPDVVRRPVDGAAFARALRRAQGRRLLRSANPLISRARDARDEAAAFELEAAELQRSEGDARALRERSWALQDRAAERRGEADLREAQWLQKAREVVVVAPDLVEGWARLVEWQCDQLQVAEAVGDGRNVMLGLEALRTDRRRLEASIEGSARKIKDPVRHILRRSQRLLDGTATVTLRTPPDARIDIAPQVPVERRLVVGETIHSARGGLVEHPLPFGRLIARVTAPGRRSVVYPLHLRRGEQWGLDAPPGVSRSALPLPPLDAFDHATEAYIAPGWCRLGGERFACDAPTGRRVWVDGFIAQRNPVTHGEYLEYLNDLVARGRLDEARRRVPGHRQSASRRPPAQPDYRFVGDRFEITDDGGTAGRPVATVEAIRDWPLAGISWFDAMHYAAWRARRDGLPWRLPCEWEFEKVARCGDDRRLPWGQHLEPEWLHPAGITRLLLPVPVGTRTVDETLHRVRWTVSNCMTWCLDAWQADGPKPDAALDLAAILAATGRRAELRMMRGCTYYTPKDLVSGATRFAAPPRARPTAGLRLVRAWPHIEAGPLLPPPPGLEDEDADTGE